MQDLILHLPHLVLIPRCCWLVATSLTPTLRTRTFYHLLWVETIKETPDQEGLSWVRLFLSICSAAVQPLAPAECISRLNICENRSSPLGQRTCACFSQILNKPDSSFVREEGGASPSGASKSPSFYNPFHSSVGGFGMRPQPPFPSLFSDSWRDQCSTPLVMSTSVSW